MSDLFPDKTLAGLGSSNWKDRLASVEEMIAVISFDSINAIINCCYFLSLY